MKHFRSLFVILLINIVAMGLIVQGGQADGDLPRVYIPMVTTGGSLATPAPSFPSEADFVQTVRSQNASQVTGVYVRDVLALSVVQQPANNYTYISSSSNAATQYSLAVPGVVGLLAHNTIAGKHFFDLKNGQKVSLIFGDGSVKRYTIKKILEYQAVSPTSYSSDFIDLKTGEQLSGAELFSQVYLGNDHITFQTCIAKNGNASWGRLFVIAEPY